MNQVISGKTLSLTPTGASGEYVFESSSYFPIDGEGFGNEGRSHNFHFCSEVHTAFAYHGNPNSNPNPNPNPITPQEEPDDGVPSAEAEAARGGASSSGRVS